MDKYNRYSINCALLGVAIFVAALCDGCADRAQDVRTQNLQNAGTQKVITENEATEIAKKEYIANGGSGSYKASVQKTDMYIVTIEMEPSTPGGHFMVYIASDGRVIGTFPGN